MIEPKPMPQLDATDEELIREVYPQLRVLARHLLRKERANHTLRPTALANEAFLRLFGKKMDLATLATPSFLGYAAQQMRCILIDYGRKNSAAKRGAGYSRVPLLDTVPTTSIDPDLLLGIDAALQKLAAIDERAAHVAELKLFGGFTSAEAAAILGVCSATVDDSWQYARLWLFRELNGRPR